MCSSSKKDEMHTEDTAAAADTSGIPDRPAPQIAIAPGSAQVTATLIRAEETEQGYHCVLRVEQVHQYGSSTPPLPKGADIKALISSQVLQSLGDDAQVASLMAPDNKMEITLRHAGIGKMMGSDAPSWQVSSINP